MGQPEEWVVEVEFAVPDGVRVLEDHVDDLLDATQPHDGVPFASRGSIGVSIGSTAGTADAAIADGIKVARKIMRTAGISGKLSVERAEATTVARTERDILKPNYPEVLGAAEVARELGVSRQRVAELRAAGRLPEPFEELAAGPVWAKREIERFLKKWPRKSGRPRHSA